MQIPPVIQEYIHYSPPTRTHARFCAARGHGVSVFFNLEESPDTDLPKTSLSRLVFLQKVLHSGIVWLFHYSALYNAQGELPPTGTYSNVSQTRVCTPEYPGSWAPPQDMGFRRSGLGQAIPTSYKLLGVFLLPSLIWEPRFEIYWLIHNPLYASGEEQGVGWCGIWWRGEGVWTQSKHETDVLNLGLFESLNASTVWMFCTLPATPKVVRLSLCKLAAASGAQPHKQQPSPELKAQCHPGLPESQGDRFLMVTSEVLEHFD